MVTARRVIGQARVYDPQLLASLGADESLGVPKVQRKSKSSARMEDACQSKPQESCTLLAEECPPPARKEPVPLVCLRKSNSRRQRKQEEAETKMLTSVLSGFLGAEGVVKDAQETLNVADQVKRRKREKLHADWSRNVHETIQKRIHGALRKMNVEDIEHRHRRALQDYLNTSNKKSAAVFRDVIIEADYDPLQYGRRSIKFRVDDIKDPCQLDQWKAEREASLMGGAGPRVELGKSVLPIVQWDKLESTPYGRNMLPDGSYVIKPINEKLVELQKSRVYMDHYNTTTGKAVVDAETPKGKGVARPDSSGLPDFFEIIQRVDENVLQNDLISQGKAVGDHWLSHRGRKIGEGPEMRRGRKNLFDVMQNKCVEGLQTAPHFTGGDMWLEARGKANAPGPEQLRGRQNLFETFQQSSNPYTDGVLNMFIGVGYLFELSRNSAALDVLPALTVGLTFWCMGTQWGVTAVTRGHSYIRVGSTDHSRLPGHSQRTNLSILDSMLEAAGFCIKIYQGRTLDDSVLESAARGKLAQFPQKQSQNNMFTLLHDALHASKDPDSSS